MDAVGLYAQLEKDFIAPALSDDWARYMSPVSDFLTDNFKKRSMGLVCNNSTVITCVWTAVFPSVKVMQYLLDTNKENMLLFVHHPEIWDIRKTEIFQQMDIKLLKQFKERGISIYNLHVPLDNYGEYSTSVSLARAQGVTDLQPFARYYGSMAGVFGTTDCFSLIEISRHFSALLGHYTSMYQYGSDEIINQRVAVVAGGGNLPDVLKEIAGKGINTFITGVSALNDHSRAAHLVASENRINILGGTHYSTEKFACIAMCRYFQKLGLPCGFIEDIPVLEDM
jgi:putative NIF3 family GTP cyclohydrolase 1 type 2